MRKNRITKLECRVHASSEESLGSEAIVRAEGREAYHMGRRNAAILPQTATLLSIFLGRINARQPHTKYKIATKSQFNSTSLSSSSSDPSMLRQQNLATSEAESPNSLYSAFWMSLGVLCFEMPPSCARGMHEIDLGAKGGGGASSTNRRCAACAEVLVEREGCIL